MSRTLPPPGRPEDVLRHVGPQTENTVDHVVTEWGLARLRGRSLAERAQALIAIAHPDHREELEREAVEAGLLRKGGPRAGEAPAGRRAHASAPSG